MLGGARSEGEEVLQREILQECKKGYPPFVLSDAFPVEYLPIPEITRFFVDSSTKEIKKARFISLESFQNSQRGCPCSLRG